MNPLAVKIMGAIAMAMKATCKDTSPLISEMMDHSLPPLKRWRLKFHLAICEVCRYYREQLEILRSLGRRMGREDAGIDGNVFLRREKKEKIRSLVDVRD